MADIIQLEEREYKRLSSFIMSQYGIKLPPVKKTLLQCRLQKRLQALHFSNFKEYVDYAFSSGDHNEITLMIDAVTTNKTDFFREPGHFDYLLEEGIERLIQKTGKRSFTIWSAGCSSGEEPYTIAMVLSEFSLKQPVEFTIMATDISSSVLEHARVGIYNEEKTGDIPLEFKKKYLLKGKNNFVNKVRIIPQLQNRIQFRKFNLLSSDFSSMGKFDIIFCRNVMIYFDRQVQHQVLKHFADCINNEGLLFLGHSESLAGHELPFISLRPTIFEKGNPLTRNKKY
ncbi:MAG TPA: protein-glutamate O-methyltransferase CheR [Bacteroidales bacterium]|nr:protein-glutamate O-methyltransferase CheR [Bacteroidales bacterium]